MDEKQLKEKILKEQDIIGQIMTEFYGPSEMYTKEPKLNYDDLTELMTNDDEILSKLKINNLVKVLTNLDLDKDKEKIENIRKIVSERLDKEPFYLEDTESAPFLKTIHSVNKSMAYIGINNVLKIKVKAANGLKELKGTEFEKVASKFTSVVDAANFLKYQKEGTFNAEKINMLESMLDKDEHALEYVNFGLFKDNIYNNMSKEFVEYISKFPTLSNKLVNLADNNPKLYSVVSNRVNGYENLIDNYSEIENMIEGFSKNCYNVELDKIDENTPDNLITWLGASKQAEDYVISLKYNDFPPKYAENYQEKLDKYWDEKFKETKSKKEELSINFKENQDRLIQVEEMLEGDLDKDEKFKLKMEKIDLDYLVKNMSEDIKKEYDGLNDIYFQKHFSMSYDDARRIISEYGNDLDNIEGIDSEKEFFNALKDKVNSNSDLSKIYQEDATKYSYNQVNKIKEKIARECAKTYVSGLKETDDKVQQAISKGDKELCEQVDVDGKKVNIVKLKGKFNLFLHSTDTGFIYDKELEEDYDFKKAWKDQSNKTDHILSTAYSTQDFVGAPPLKNNGVMYAFASLPKENIRLMGVTDINTYNRQFSYDSGSKQYMTAKTMPYSSRRVYSEFALEKKDPDYVVLYDDATEEIKNNTLKAASQFGIPVVYMDKKEIVNEQIGSLNKLIDDFEKTGNTDTLKKVINRYETNVSGWVLNRKEGEDESHTKDIDNSRFKDNFNEVEERIQSTVSSYLDKVQSSKDDMSYELTEIATTILAEKKLYEDSLTGGPDKKISGTHMSLDSDKIITKLNSVFDSKGLTNFKVANDTNLKKYLKMKEIAKNAICRERISSTQVKEALSVEMQNRNMEDKTI